MQILSQLTAIDYYNRGVTKALSGDYQGAIADYNEAIKLKSDYAEAYNNRGISKVKLGDNQAAIADFNQAIKLKPDYADAYMGRGFSKNNLKDYQGAITDFNQWILGSLVIAMVPLLSLQVLAQGKTFVQPQPQILSQLTAIDCFNRGNTKQKSGDNQGAIADFNQAIKLNPDDSKAYYNRGNSKYNLKDYQGGDHGLQSSY